MILVGCPLSKFVLCLTSWIYKGPSNPTFRSTRGLCPSTGSGTEAGAEHQPHAGIFELGALVVGS